MSKEELKAVGVHVFAGGFTAGIKAAGWRVDEQLEVHGFGLETTEKMNDVETVNCAARKWPRRSGLMAFGNPRCTAFSTLTSGDRYIESNAHGAFAKQTCDIQELAAYTAGHYDFIVWESVQQAYTKANELIRWCIDEHFAPKGYRIAHLLINAATFGNSQQRKRYFFVAYRDCYRFCIQPPTIPWHYATMFDAIGTRRGRVTREVNLSKDEYDEDCSRKFGDNARATIPNLPNGWSQNTLARHGYWLLTDKDKKTWDERESDIPFSLHALWRMQWCRPSPTLHSSAPQWIHPDLHRGLTVGEIATIMGWPVVDDKQSIPVGPNPAAQIAKGIVPAIGTWLAEQVRLSYEDHWNGEDWESSFDDRSCVWTGGSAVGRIEKLFDLTRYCPKLFHEERHRDAGVLKPSHIFNVSNGRVVKPWSEARRDATSRSLKVIAQAEMAASGLDGERTEDQDDASENGSSMNGKKLSTEPGEGICLSRLQEELA